MYTPAVVADSFLPGQSRRILRIPTVKELDFSDFGFRMVVLPLAKGVFLVLAGLYLFLNGDFKVQNPAAAGGALPRAWPES